MKSSPLNVDFGEPIKVMAMKTSKIWCNDGEIFIRCATQESNDSEEGLALTHKISALYNNKRVPPGTIRNFEKNWIHEGQLVVAPWVEINTTDLYRGVVTNVDPENQLAEISHLGEI